MAEVVSKGDFVEVSFEAKVDGGASIEKTGKPLLVCAGAGQVIAGLDELLIGSKLGVERKEKIPRAKAFGERNPSLVKLLPLTEFSKRGIDPVPGQTLDVDGMPARVQSVNGGRVRLDFNHELAGNDLEYSFKVEKIYSTPKDKVDALKRSFLDRVGVDASGIEHLRGTPAEVGVSLEGESVKVTVPQAMNKTTEYIVAKGHFIAQCLTHVPGVKKVVFNEEYGAQGAAPGDKI